MAAPAAPFSDWLYGAISSEWAELLDEETMRRVANSVCRAITKEALAGKQLNLLHDHFKRRLEGQTIMTRDAEEVELK
eukprot:2483999-Amphidinium_carterae.1